MVVLSCPSGCPGRRCMRAPSLSRTPAGTLLAGWPPSAALGPSLMFGVGEPVGDAGAGRAEADVAALVAGAGRGGALELMLARGRQVAKRTGRGGCCCCCLVLASAPAGLPLQGAASITGRQAVGTMGRHTRGTIG